MKFTHTAKLGRPKPITKILDVKVPKLGRRNCNELYEVKHIANHLSPFERCNRPTFIGQLIMIYSLLIKKYISTIYIIFIIISVDRELFLAL